MQHEICHSLWPFVTYLQYVTDMNVTTLLSTLPNDEAIESRLSRPEKIFTTQENTELTELFA